MSSADPRPSTLDRILDAAITALEQHGLRRTTMDDIAGGAGISRPTLYGYFPNKPAIVGAAITRDLEGFLARLDAVGAQAADPAERLRAVFASAYAYLRDHRLLHRLLETEPEAILPQLTGDAPALRIGYAWAAQELLAARGGQGEPTRRDHEAAEMLVRLMHSLVLSPPVNLELDTPAALDAFAERWLVPWLDP